MALKDRIATDIDRVFMQMNHFAETHYWNGQPITCIPDEEDALKRKNNNVNDISWDNNTRDILIHTPLKDFPGGREPEPNTSVMFDNRPMYIGHVVHNMGVIGIYLHAIDPREIV
jgi:hypothetical protein